MSSVAQFLYKLKDTSWGIKLQKSPWGYRLFDELGKGFLFPLLGVPIDMDVRVALGGNRGDPILKTAHPLVKGEYSILLIQPPIPDNTRHQRMVPIGLASLAAFLRQEFSNQPFNVGILDAQCQNLSIAEIIPLLNKWPWDVIGISYMTVQNDLSVSLAGAIRAIMPQTKVICGGNHPTASPESAIDRFDVAFLGESEITLKEWIECQLNKQSADHLPGIAYKTPDGKKIINPERPLEPSLDRFPDMAWDLLPVHSYDWPLHVVGGRRLPIMASRGCPYSCKFCSATVHWRHKVRYRSPQRVLDEIKHLQKTYAIDYYHFKDSNFGIDQKFVEEFCSLVIAAKLNITWISMDRASFVIRNKALLPLMRKAGCIGIEIGIESSDQHSYSEMNKDQDLGEALEAIKLQKECGMVPQFTYMAFVPGDTINTYYHQKTLIDDIYKGGPIPRYTHAHPFPLYHGQFTTVYPGTAFFLEKDKMGMSLLEDPELAHHFTITFLPHTLLEDIPFWTVKTLEERDLELFGVIVWQVCFAQFPGKLPNRRLVMRIWDACQGLVAFFRACDGTRTLHKAALRVADELNWNLFKALRICGLASYYFSQQGMVRSAVHGREDNIQIRRVPLPAFRRRIIRFLMWKYAPMKLKALADS
ncbi:MAG: radical SAM protein [Candidatus Ozemobacteraceae bacterium]